VGWGDGGTSRFNGFSSRAKAAEAAEMNAGRASPG